MRENERERIKVIENKNGAGEIENSLWATSYVVGLVQQSTHSVIVQGSRDRGAAKFVAESDGAFPWLILRDPPGDASYSTWSSAQALTFSTSVSSKRNKARFGSTKFEIEYNTAPGFGPFLFGHFTGPFLAAGFKIDESVHWSEDRTIGHDRLFDVSVTLSQGFSTHAGPGLPPPLGDLIIGGTVLYKYLETDVITVENCTVSRSTSIEFKQASGNTDAMSVLLALNTFFASSHVMFSYFFFLLFFFLSLFFLVLLLLFLLFLLLVLILALLLLLVFFLFPFPFPFSCSLFLF